MLGRILSSLTDETAAEATLAAIADPTLLRRVRELAQASDISPGAYAAASVRHVLDHGGEDVWLDLLGRMARTAQPGVAALGYILAKSFPEQAICAGHHG